MNQLLLMMGAGQGQQGGGSLLAFLPLIAIIVAAISLIFAAIALLSLLFIGTGLAILGSGGML